MSGAGSRSAWKRVSAGSLKAVGGALAIACALQFWSGALTGAQGQEAGPGGGEDVWKRHAAPDDEVGKNARIVLPFTKDQIRALARLLEQTQRASATGSGRAVEGRLRRVRIDADTIPEVWVRRGYTTVVGFTDLTGAPWPIEEVLVDRRFLAGEETAPNGHLLYLSPREPFLEGNLAVKLVGLADPVVAMLGARGDSADFRVDLRLEIAGPNVDASALAKPEAFRAGDEVLAGVLAGTVPGEAERLEVVGGGPGDRAWRLGGDVVLVTRAHVLSPGPWAAERGSAGRWAYRLPDTPLLLVSEQGREKRLTLRASEVVGSVVSPAGKPGVAEMGGSGR